MAAPDAGRVTAGLPSLDPSRRFQIEQKERKRLKDLAMDRDFAQKRDAAVSPDGERPRTDYQACVGIPLHSSELIKRLTALNPALWFTRNQYVPVMQIWINGDNGKRFVCGFEAEYSPEFTVILYHEEEHLEGRGKDAHFIKVKVCDDTVRGWRTVLKTLIREKIISRTGVERMFGTVNSCSWQALTSGY